MLFTLRLLIGGIAMVPAGVMVTLMGFMPDSLYPAGKFAGPVLSILGVVLIVMAIKELRRPK